MRTKLVLAVIFIIPLTVTVYGYFSSVAVAEAIIPLEITFLLPSTPASSAGLDIEDDFPTSSSALEASE
ncbi:MAG: hypothetical protein LBT59_19655 [Clostridiales bacterium]|nr:hypothetical protein [Clostridiales bacterium]